MDLENLKIVETSKKDLDNIRKLWASGEVMCYVGFPQGLHYSRDEIEKWYEKLDKDRLRKNHFSIYFNEEFCGETFYSIDNQKSSSVDIKLFPKFRGIGIGSKALQFAIDKAFEMGAKRCCVDPNRDNLKAIALYERLGFERKEFPEGKNPGPNYLYFEIEK